MFCPGEAEIRGVLRYLFDSGAAVPDHDVTGTDHVVALPLYGSLPFAEQQRAINPNPNPNSGTHRRVIVSTPIAESSLTIPGNNTHNTHARTQTHHARTHARTHAHTAARVRARAHTNSYIHTGVRVVVDSGLRKRPTFNSNTGLERLETVRGTNTLSYTL